MIKKSVSQEMKEFIDAIKPSRRDIPDMKNTLLLIAGKITPQEFDRRMAKFDREMRKRKKKLSKVS